MKDNRKNNGGPRLGSGPREIKQDADKIMGVSFSFKKKLVQNAEDRARLKSAVYEYVNNVYEPNLKIIENNS